MEKNLIMKSREKKLQQILTLVQEFVDSKETTWEPGRDWVYYAGPYFNSEEYVNGIESFLKGWLVLGKDGTRFEKRFSKLLGKDYGLLTNSGSSANLLMMAAMASKNLNNFQKGTKVLTPIAGFPTTINPIFQTG